MALENTVSSIIPIIRGLIHDQVKTDGQLAFEYDSSNKFNLTKSFIKEDSIRVLVNGEEIGEDDFSYNSDTNQVVIDFVDSGDDLVADDIIVILFSYYQKYSDTEIEGYLNSALGYFVQYKYPKTFEIDDNSNILAVEDSEPTIDELYFISIIASILIDPQNVEVDTPEFKLTANRDTSDQEQIKQAFFQYKRFVGKVYFEKLDICDDICP